MATQDPGSQANRRETAIGRGWRLTAASWRLTWRNRTVLTLAILGAIAGSAAFAAAVILASSGRLGPSQIDHGHLVAGALLGFYPLAFLGVFFDVAMAAAAGASLDGGRMKIGEALRSAHHRVLGIALWAFVTALFAFLLRIAGFDSPGSSVIAVWSLALLWVVATIFIVPILALEDAGLGETVRVSRTLLGRSWRENLTGLAVIGLGASFIAIPSTFFLFVGAASAVLTPGGGALIVSAIGLLGLVLARVIGGSIRQVFAVALYRYAASASA